MISPGSTLAQRYRVLRRIAGGGMKEVYLAEDLRLANRRCALAEMIDSSSDPDTRQQSIAAFNREANILAALEHEHIVRVYDRFSEHNRHYLVMEYVTGETLEKKLRSSGGKLEEAAVVNIALQVLEALEYLHGLNPPILYRDLKPSNVMITAPGRVKLIDFGIARHFQPRMTATMIGTQGYAPPEQYSGKVEVRSDIYALGAMMHHLLTGRDPSAAPPFSFPPVRQLAPSCSESRAVLIEQALAYKVEQRLSSAGEFRRRLLEAAADQKPEPLASTVPGLKRNRAGPGEDTIECRHCTRRIPIDARTCPYCSKDLTDAAGVRTRLPGAGQTLARVIVANFRRFAPIGVAAVVLAVVVHLALPHHSMPEGVDPALVGTWREAGEAYSAASGQMTLDIAPWGSVALSDWGGAYHGCVGRIAATNRRWQIREVSGEIREGKYSISWPVSNYGQAEQLSMANGAGRITVWSRESAESQQPPPDARKIVVGIVTDSSADELKVVTDRAMSSYMPEGTPITLSITPSTQIIAAYGSPMGSRPQVGSEVTVSYSGMMDEAAASEIRVLSQTPYARPATTPQTNCPW